MPTADFSSQTHFHLIQENEALTPQVLERLLAIYPCSQRELQKLGLTFSQFRSENLKSVTLDARKKVFTLTCTSQQKLHRAITPCQRG